MILRAATYASMRYDCDFSVTSVQPDSMNGESIIHPTLQRDCETVGRFTLCHLLLMKDANYPWFILVPDRPDVSEIYQLNEADQLQLLHESSYLAQKLALYYRADKINIAALGNVVPQLHIHHVVRYRDDVAWPAPVWGAAPAKPYNAGEIDSRIAEISGVLTELVGGNPA
jgi:diadenosine tetraphosphate (Ap4A) HIT family hydrolase